ncbi:MAG TPA: ThuA domain-containing protein [Bryobacteraceae bacterium]|nr:ThuA domain-containing protein [Bryobacteraceae bacterium]
MKKRSLTAAGLMATCAIVLAITAQLQAQTRAGETRGAQAQNETAKQSDIDAMMAVLPGTAPAKPLRAHKVLVLCRAQGFVHSSIPLAAKMVEALGAKTGAWSTVVTYNSADINAANLRQFDAIFLDNTTGLFLDDPDDAAATAARKQALLDFVRGGKGLVGIHAATDSYHGVSPGTGAPPAPGVNEPLWPDFNRMIGGYFKFHWVYPQRITVKIDDPKSPLTAMFHGQEYEIHDETYTFAQNSFSRKNVHVLTSVDYAKMSDEDKAKETDRRTDGDYALSYIRREGRGRVFYEAHGHSETVYAIKPFLEHMLAGIQYALSDLKADDRPSAK